MKMTVEHFEETIAAFRPRQRILEVKNKDQNKQYRLVSNNPNRIEYWQQMGYEVVTIKKGEEGPQSSSEGQPDQRQVVAGVYILMHRDKAIAEAHREALDRRAAKRQLSPRESFKRQAAKMGVGTEDTTRSSVGEFKPSPDEV